jgi:hypothetical protein
LWRGRIIHIPPPHTHPSLPRGKKANLQPLPDTSIREREREREREKWTDVVHCVAEDSKLNMRKINEKIFA